MPNDELPVVRRLWSECTDCMAQVEPHWQFCASCGERLGMPCPHCGVPIPPRGARYCPHCGTKLEQVLEAGA